MLLSNDCMLDDFKRCSWCGYHHGHLVKLKNDRSVSGTLYMDRVLSSLRLKFNRCTVMALSPSTLAASSMEK